MHEHRLKEAFDPYYDAPLESWRNFAKLCEEVSYKKKTIIKEAHRTEKYGYFLLRGATGTFVWKKNNYVCLNIFLENEFFADDLSLTSGRPSPVEIVALEDCSILRITRTDIETLKKTPIGRMLFFVGEQIDNAKNQTQQINLLTKTAEERYLELMETRPELLHRIPQKYIASFLGITTQSLSRIRRKIK